jgi:hypothetical protein
MWFDGFKLNWVTGYSRVALSAKRNVDASPNQFAPVDSNDLVWQISQEISLASDRGSDFEWDVGKRSAKCVPSQPGLRVSRARF